MDQVLRNTNNCGCLLESDKDGVQNTFVPKIGMEFDDAEKAYVFYNKYAKQIGFSIRKQNLNRNSSGCVRSRKFVCYKEGYRRTKSASKKVKFEKPDERTGCKAHMAIKILKNGKFTVYRFEPHHNHEAATPSKAHMLKSQRMMNQVHVADAELASNAGVKQRASYDYFAGKAGSRRSLPFSRVDLKNCLRKLRAKEMEAGDGGAIMHYLQKRVAKDRRFFSAIQVDEADQLTNIFWTDARSRIDYENFGDVVCFDTTYKTNGYGRPFAPFVGVNHHKQTVIFGAALLYDETTETFKWLFECFIEAMNGKAPKVILTDQDMAMQNAIGEVWPETTHRLCVWHMYQNAAKHLSHVFQASKSFKVDFGKCVYDYEYEDEFLKAWEDMLIKYDLKDNEWLSKLFRNKEKWALVYGRETFCADMKSTQRSESINGVIKTYLKTDQNLMAFFMHFDRLVEDRRYNELEADFRASQSTPSVPLSQLLKQAANTYTSNVYEMFAEEFKLFVDCSLYTISEFGTIFDYKVIDELRKRTSYVRYDSSSLELICSCKKFDFVGILCCHALKVLDHQNIKYIPEQYILKRWRKDAKAGIKKSQLDDSSNIDPKVAMINRYDSLAHMYNQIVAKASETQEAYEVAVMEAEMVMEKVEKVLQKNLQVAESTQHEENYTPNPPTSTSPTTYYFCQSSNAAFYQ